MFRLPLYNRSTPALRDLRGNIPTKSEIISMQASFTQNFNYAHLKVMTATILIQQPFGAHFEQQRKHETSMEMKSTAWIVKVEVEIAGEFMEELVSFPVMPKMNISRKLI